MKKQAKNKNTPSFKEQASNVVKSMKKGFKDDFKKLVLSKNNIWIFIISIFIFAILYTAIPVLLSSYLEQQNYTPIEVTIDKNIGANVLSAKYFDKVSSENIVGLNFLSDTNQFINFSGEIGGNPVNLSPYISKSGVTVSSFPPFQSSGNKDFNIVACDNNKKCATFSGQVSVFSYDNYRTIKLIELIFSTILFVVFLVALGVAISAIGVPYLRSMVAVVPLAISGILWYIASLFPLSIWSLIPAYAFMMSMFIFVYTYLIFSNTKKDKRFVQQFVMVAAFIIIWCYLIFIDPFLCYLTALIGALIYVLLLVKPKKKLQYAVLIVTLIGILFSSFIFQPIFQPIMISSNESEVIHFSGPTQPLTINTTEFHVKRPLISTLPFGTDEFKVPIAENLWLKTISSTCAEQIGQGKGYLRFRIKLTDQTDCKILLNYTYENKPAMDWAMYVNTLTDVAEFNEQPTDVNGYLKFWIKIIKYDGAFEIENYPFPLNLQSNGSDKVIPIITTVNGMPTRPSYSNTDRYVPIDLIPGKTTVIIEAYGLPENEQQAKNVIETIKNKYATN